MTRIYDLHSHVLFGLDDGSIDLNMSIEMLNLMIAQGVTDVYCTSHDTFGIEEYDTRFEILSNRVSDLKLNITLHKGCEIFCDESFVDTIIDEINSGRLFPLGDSNYYLLEFSTQANVDNIVYCVKRILNKTNAKIVLAHAERYYKLGADIFQVKDLIDLGVKIQVNAYSLICEPNTFIKTFARTMLQGKMISFIGSDSHRTTHRPPRLKEGIEYILNNCDEEYANELLYANAEKYLNANAGTKLLEISRSVMIGHAVADALGVPVEFCYRSTLKENPVTDMQAYGTHCMPKGTWSDDTSMSLCALNELYKREIDFDKIMKNFVLWHTKDKFTATDYSFDIGLTCSRAISNYIEGMPIDSCAEPNPNYNGNGSLMRIHPFVLHLYRINDLSIAQKVEIIERASALTHAHDISKMACGIYAFILWQLIDEPSIDSVTKGLAKAKKYYSGKEYVNVFDKLFNKIGNLDGSTPTPVSDDEIKSSGYVVDTLEASVWCLLTTASYKDCVLKAVNLGSDTDTVGAVAGGLAGALYGYDAIPKKWRDDLLRREYIEDMVNRAFGSKI